MVVICYVSLRDILRERDLEIRVTLFTRHVNFQVHKFNLIINNFNFTVDRAEQYKQHGMCRPIIRREHRPDTSACK